MSRVLNVPIEVPSEAGGAEAGDGAEAGSGNSAPLAPPKTFTFRSKRYRVIRVLECWRQTGRWWTGEGERVVHRVEVAGGGIFELAYEAALRRWFLYRVFD